MWRYSRQQRKPSASFPVHRHLEKGVLSCDLHARRLRGPAYNSRHIASTPWELAMIVPDIQPQAADAPRVLEALDPAPPVAHSTRRRTEPRSNAWAALAATAVVAAAAPAVSAELLALTFVVFAAAGFTLGRASRWSAMLPLTRVLVRLCHPVCAIVVLWATGQALAPLLVPLTTLAAAGAAALLTAALARRRASAATTTRIAVVGDPRSAEQLRLKLQEGAHTQHTIVGVVVLDAGEPAARDSQETLGSLAALDELIAEHAIDLLVIDRGTPMTLVFDRLADSGLYLPVRVCELTQFYEDTFGHVPVTEIDSAWFAYIMHPRFRSHDTASKRVLDLVVALTALVVFAPLLIACAVAIKLHDGGPVLFRQRRIGSDGDAFTLLKLRTMRPTSSAARWSSANDPRVTPVGRLLRRTHLDEMPQLLNVLRGEMTVVGPRPEQPEFVERLERTIPHYSRRHLIKPGLTGWAQVRCGYAGSEEGSSWKLCHDLFYLKHRSLGLDLAILAETFRTLVADRQFQGAGSVQAMPLQPTTTRSA